MSTKGLVNFIGPEGDKRAVVYLHNAGQDVVADINKFMRAVAGLVSAGGLQSSDARFHDPTYLAARYVCWVAAGDLLCQGIGVVIPNQWYANREFNVLCHYPATLDLPEVMELTG